MSVPDPTNPDLLLGMRTYLVSLGLVREPRTAGSLPPLWLARRQGVPGPGETQGLTPEEISTDLVVGAEKATGIPQKPYEGFIRQDGVQFTIRSSTAQIAYAFENNLRVALNDKRAWLMGNVPVNESMLYRDLQPLGSDNLGFNFTLEYMFNLWGPFTPAP